MAEQARPTRIDTPRVPVTDTYHGVTVIDDYRWLEDATSSQSKAWTRGQDRRTRDYLGGVASYDAIKRRTEEILKAESASHSALCCAGDRYFALERRPPKQQPFLITFPDLDDLTGNHVVVDPNELDPGGTTTIDWFEPSPDGALVAVSLSSHGTEDGTVHVYETATGVASDVAVPGVSGGTAGGSLAWAGDSSGFWYTRYPRAEERPEEELPFYQEVWFHSLGSSVASDRRELSGVFADDRIAENFLTASSDGRWVMDRVQEGDGGAWQVFVRSQDADGWWQVADVAGKCVDAAFGNGTLYLLSRLDAPNGKVLRLALDAGATVANAEMVVPTTDVTIEDLAVTDTCVWLLDMDGGTSSVRRFTLDGSPLEAIDVGRSTAIDGLVRLDDTHVAYASESFVTPRTWWSTSGEAPPHQTALATMTPLNFSGLESWRVFATSADGTRVPITLVGREGAPQNAATPVLLLGYGGYGISMKPWFNPSLLPWLEQGNIFAVAHIRGGGEYGEQWHHAGRLTTKQNVFDDFTACALHLVESGLTTVDQLAIIGGSNGGLLMGAVLTQHPDIARAVAAMVPITDMLRVELHPNGAFNVTEFGTVEDPALFKAMFAYSPYHNVRDGISYPAVLLTAGEFDPRVDAYHAKKLAARLQTATMSEEPVLLRIESGGHGIGESLDQTVEEFTDLYAFLFDRLDLDYDENLHRDVD